MSGIGSIAGVEQLSAPERTALSALLTQSQQRGVLVGALRGAVPWDLRPLVFDGGSTFLVRLSAPENDPVRLRSLEALLPKLLAVRDLIGIVDGGVLLQQLWIRRRFYSLVLSEASANHPILVRLEPRQLIGRLLQQIAALHSQGAFHGHICASNVALELDQAGAVVPLLLDSSMLISEPAQLARYRSSEQGRSSLAPELAAGKPPGAHTDLFGLGLVAQQLEGWGLLERLKPAQRQILERCAAGEPWSRPTMQELMGEFLEQNAMPSSVGGLAPPAAGRGGALRSGKILGDIKIVKEESTYRSSAAPSSDQERLDINAAELVRDDRVAASARSDLSKDTPRSSNLNWPKLGISGSALRTLIALAVILLLILWQSGKVGGLFSGESNNRENYDALAAWSSNQPSLMAKVAEQAIANPAGEAAKLVFSDALAGNERVKVNHEFIKKALNPAWEGELTSQDRKLVLQLALSTLVSIPPQAVQTGLEQAHPGVLVALAGTLNLSAGHEYLSKVSIDHLKTLPGQFGRGFELLKTAGIQSLADLPSLAMAHLMCGDHEQEIITAYLSDNSDPAKQLALLSALMPLIEGQKGLDIAVMNGVTGSGGLLAKTLGWFAQGDLVDWAKVSPTIVLQILTGQLVGKELGAEHYVDLLLFPIATVRRAAEKRLLSESETARFTPYLDVLVRNDNGLSRAQNLSLVLALRTPGESGEALISTWFHNNPDPQTVLRLLVAGAKSSAEDPFNLEAARYLAGTQTQISAEQLQQLLGHPEAMARALAVSRLDARIPEQAKMLETMATVEPRESVRNEIKKKLAAR
ncbi:MAG: hypothetical protein K1X83_10170 [Oligoflexia bacterium]|nr:hypothetical protein [Oligoflexia bacterium]